MPKLTKITEYLTLAELQERYQQSTTALAAAHWQIIWLLAQNQRVKTVAELTAKSQSWIRELARRYNKLGPEGLLDRRLTLPGVKPLLTEQLQSELDISLQQAPPQGGHWNGPLVARWLSQKTGRKIGRQVGWAYLQKLGYTLQQPRPHHASASETAQAEFKKNCPTK